ncbi:hypothetical protein [Catenuloplanes niger]
MPRGAAANAAAWTLLRAPRVEVRGTELVTTSPGTVGFRATLLDGTRRDGTLEFRVTGSAAVAADGVIRLSLAESVAS